MVQWGDRGDKMAGVLIYLIPCEWPWYVPIERFKVVMLMYTLSRSDPACMFRQRCCVEGVNTALERALLKQLSSERWAEKVNVKSPSLAAAEGGKFYL